MSTTGLRLRAHIHAHVVDPKLVVLHSEAGVYPLEGRLFPLLVPWLNQGLLMEEIIAHLDGALDALDVIYGVDVLRLHGALEEEQAEPLTVPPQWLALPEPPDAPVTVRAVGCDGAGRLEQLLRAAGWRVAEDAALTIVLTDDYLRPELESINREALASGRPWILAKPLGDVVWVGPRFEAPGPCWMCLATRLREVPAAWGVPPLPPSTGPVLDVGLRLAAKGRAAQLATYDLHSMVAQTHTVVRRADCPACGAQRAAGPRDQPENTYARYEHLIGPLIGVVHSIERAPGSTPLYVARSNFGRFIRSYGNSADEEQARTAALCEALERYSGHYRGDEPCIRASLRELGGAAIHPNVLLGFSGRQYAERLQWRALRVPGTWVPEPFDEDAAVDWTPAWSLTHQRVRYVLAAHCYYRHPADRNVFGGADSNGNAAGRTMDEAILHGLFELIERDAVAIWWYNRVKRPAVQSSADFAVLDLTNDVGIPAFAAVADQIVGFGAHCDPAIAIDKAIGELNQGRITSRGRCFSDSIQDRAFLEPHDVPAVPYADVRADVGACIDWLRSKELEVLVIDQTRADVGLPVVKVIVPGLRHFHPRLGPGRLYDVPPRMGWLARPLTEEELNPVHLLV